jgi:hypothetical protein
MKEVDVYELCICFQNFNQSYSESFVILLFILLWSSCSQALRG